MGDIISVWMEVFSGVPHGSVIGPFLFVVFINDLSRLIKNKLKIYADDTKILSMMRNTDDQKTLQMDLDEALKWSKE
jgi:ribonuclease P/MRP protein subunit RPP40